MDVATLCPLCNTQVNSSYLAEHVRLERKQFAGEPLTESDLLTLHQHGVRPTSTAPATRSSRRSNAAAAVTPAKAKAAASVPSTLGQYRLLVEGVLTRRRARAAATAAADNVGGGGGRARSSSTPRRTPSVPTSPQKSSRSRTTHPSASSLGAPSRQRQPAGASSSALIVDPESDDWSSVADADLGSVVCPICARYIVGDELAVNAHIDACLANPAGLERLSSVASMGDDSGGDGENENDDGASTDDDPAVYEPLPIAPPRPLPKPAAVGPRPGSAPASTVHSTSRTASAVGESDNADEEDDDEVDLDIDADTSADRTSTFGTAQFTELDVLPYSVAIHGANDLALQSLVAASGDEDAETVRKRILEEAARVAKRVQCELPSPPAATEGVLGTMSAAEKAEALTLEALKQRVVHLERLTQETPRCKVCWEGLGGKSGAPVVSVACWHVHCQECWLQSLGYRKVCPQCLVITRPEDLRKVYM